jgi:hypothetical protein
VALTVFVVAVVPCSSLTWGTDANVKLSEIASCALVYLLFIDYDVIYQKNRPWTIAIFYY